VRFGRSEAALTDLTTLSSEALASLFG
jgi:hypothetical protein